MQGNQSKDAVSPRLQDLAAANDLKDAGDFEAAYEIAYKWLKLDPNDAAAMTTMVSILIDTDKVAIAYPMAKLVTQVKPDSAVAWMNYGRTSADLWRYKESLRAYKRALSLAKDDKTKSSICVNIGSMMVDNGKFKDAEKYCRKAIVYNPDTTKGKANLGFSQLANQDWAEGWKNYRHCIGENGRYYAQYNGEPLWEGEKGGKVLIYGEQGLGDEISFAQMLPDMKAWCDDNDTELVVDVQHRLENLFKRSFPGIEIHGTRSQPSIDWNPQDITHSLPIAQLGEFFRCKDEQFTGKPYLTADPDRAFQWKALFKTKKKPVIGIGWQGGVWKTAAKHRQLTLEQLLPVLKSVDAHWVSLQYRPSGKQIAEFKEQHPDIDIVEYPAVLSNDYDDTVAMIASMDMLVTMQTTTVHVAGGLGIPCWTFVPQTSQWRYGQGGEDYPWADSVRIIRQATDGVWTDVMEKTGEELADYPGIRRATTSNARKQKDQLRNNGRGIRGNRRANGGCDGSGLDTGLRSGSQHEPEEDLQANP
jgi:tetratricopeptide (TPR) repeat protein